METGIQTNLKFESVGFPNVQFNSVKVFDQREAVKIPIDSTVDAKVYFPPEDKLVFTIIMDVRISCPGIFELSLVAIGTFRHENSIDEALKKAFVNVNAPAILFPYVRSFVSTLTCNLGFVLPHVLLPTQFFKGDLKEFIPETPPLTSVLVAH